MERIYALGFDRALWPLGLLAVGLGLIGVLSYGSVLRRLFRRRRARRLEGQGWAGPRPGGAGYGGGGFTGGLIVFLFGTTCLSLAAAASFLLLALRGFQTFNQKTWVAEVQCLETTPGRLLVYYAPVVGGTLQPARRYDVAGDQWSLGGDVLRWRPWVTMMGVRTVFKVTRLEGRYRRAQDARAKPVTAFDLEGGSDRAWQWLYRHHDVLSLMVESVYGNAVYQEPDRRRLYDVYVTTSGFMVERREPGAKPPGPVSPAATKERG